MKRLPYKGLTLSKDVYDANTTFVVVHGLEYITSALGFGGSLIDYADDKGAEPITKEYVTISSANYVIAQRHKNLEDYKKPE